MRERLVFDSDGLDRLPSAEFLEGCHEPLALPAISVAELYFGVRDGEERSRLDAFIAAFDILIVDSVIAIQAGLWRRHYVRSHGSGLADALIAASANAAQAKLVTLNRKHFPMLANVIVPYSKPSAFLEPVAADSLVKGNPGVLISATEMGMGVARASASIRTGPRSRGNALVFLRTVPRTKTWILCRSASPSGRHAGCAPVAAATDSAPSPTRLRWPSTPSKSARPMPMVL
jgi:predicted nucleic acid-binding protein